MRITNSMMSDMFLKDMNTNLENLSIIQKQRTSGKNFSKPSDDPSNVVRAMQLHSDINSNKQYNKNINNVINWLDVTDTALDQVGSQLGKIRDKLIAAKGAAYGDTERKAVKDEINEIIGSMSQSLNTTFDGKYVFSGTRVTAKPVNTTIDANGNKQLVYCNKEGNDMTIDINTSKALKNISTVLDTEEVQEIKNLGFMESKDPATGKITITVTVAGGSKLNVVSSKTGSVSDPIKIKGTASGKEVELTFGQIKELKEKFDEYIQYEQMGEKVKAEISQGVVMDYNVTAPEILNFKDKDGKDKDLRDVLQQIVNHLDGNNDKGSKPATDKEKEENILKLVNGDLQNVTDAIDNLLKIRSEVGAKQNRMDDADDMNKETNFNIQEILSNTEDVNVVEKTMEFSVLQSIYVASLQTSAKVLQPTLMDYLR